MLLLLRMLLNQWDSGLAGRSVTVRIRQVNYASMRGMKLLKLVVVQHLLRARSCPWTQIQIGCVLLLLMLGLLLLLLEQLLVAALAVTAEVDAMLRFSSCWSSSSCRAIATQ